MDTRSLKTRERNQKKRWDNNVQDEGTKSAKCGPVAGAGPRACLARCIGHLFLLRYFQYGLHRHKRSPCTVQPSKQAIARCIHTGWSMGKTIASQCPMPALVAPVPELEHGLEPEPDHSVLLRQTQSKGQRCHCPHCTVRQKASYANHPSAVVHHH